MGTAVSAVAVALGAHMIEKHFTLDRSEGGVDSAFSLEPAELAELVEAARIERVAVGIPTFTPTAAEGTVLENRRSRYIVDTVAKGAEITTETVRSISNGQGMKQKYIY